MNEVTMQSESKIEKLTPLMNIIGIEEGHLSVMREWIIEAWTKVAPAWPLKNMIAANPLQGLEDLPFEQAIVAGQSYFQQLAIPPKMADVNRETIKWCQAFFDEGQATINMPYRNQGLYHSWRQLAQYDQQLHQSNSAHRIWLENLPLSAEEAINECLVKLNIPPEKSAHYFTLLLTTLPGWASFIKYQTEWAKGTYRDVNSVTQADYLAIRLIITLLLWPEAIDLLNWYENTPKVTASEQLKKITDAENNYQKYLLAALSQEVEKHKTTKNLPTAQLIFCIDVRSEPFRRALEAQGNYETFGFAGFFGIPVQIENELTGESYSSCPVLLTPKHTVRETLCCSNEISKAVFHGRSWINKFKRLYQALKYTFTTPFALVEALGIWSGLWMSLRTISPAVSVRLKQNILSHFHQNITAKPLLTKQNTVDGIDFQDQCLYAEKFLRLIGLTDNFARLIILCGHGSTTQNNAYASALDCGACGGNHGDGNARILEAILNNVEVRAYLAKNQILIPVETKFIAALHNTTTDEFTFNVNPHEIHDQDFNKLKYALEIARAINSQRRCQKMGYQSSKNDYIEQVKKCSADWAETRPEWGLARNAAFIIGPRTLTKHLDLDGRAFLHSHNWRIDEDGSLLTTILTAPMIVAQWINSQYLFSSLDNVAYGSGSKVTQNITGKIGIMQGNGSDLMHGLPLQSIRVNDNTPYHEPLRLMTIVQAPRFFISSIISHQAILQKLFSNGWVFLVCMDPTDGKTYRLQRDLTWCEA